MSENGGADDASCSAPVRRCLSAPFPAGHNHAAAAAAVAGGDGGGDACERERLMALRRGIVRTQLSSGMTLTRKVRPTPQSAVPDAAAAGSVAAAAAAVAAAAPPPSPLRRPTSTAAFARTFDVSNPLPQLTRPLSASAVLISHGAVAATPSGSSGAAAAVRPGVAPPSASPLRVRSYSNDSVVPSSGPGSNPHATATVASLRTLLGQTEGVLARLAAAAAASTSPADSEPMQRDLRAKIASLRAELERRRVNPSAPGSSSSVPSSPGAVTAVAVAPSPIAAPPSHSQSLPLPLALFGGGAGHSSNHASALLFASSPKRSRSACSASTLLSPSGSALVAEQLRAQRESALRAQHAQARALHSKQQLDEELDALRKEAQLSSICEMEENSLEAVPGEEVR